MDQALVDEARELARSEGAGEADLLRQLAAIPSPTGHEGDRARFVAQWLRDAGAPDVEVDQARNVLCWLPARRGKTDGQRDVVVFAAHTDIVADDREPLPLAEHDGRLCAPGVGDDTANLVALLWATGILLGHPDLLAQVTRKADLLVVADAGEEGLGNLAGTCALFDGLAAAGRQVRAFHSFDLYLPQCISRAVGSERWRIAVGTQGGHSYHDFGRPNAVEVLCSVVEDLYALEPPADPTTGAPTTMNVGRFEGGGAVNAIASQAQALFEYRSESAASLAWMRDRLQTVVEAHRTPDVEVTLDLVGERPGNGEVDAAALAALTGRASQAIRAVTGQEPDLSPASTDANIPLSRGIPAVTVGAVRGALLHTRDEWVDLASLEDGLTVALALMLSSSDPLG